MPNQIIPIGIYQKDPNWLPNASPDRRKGYVHQEVKRLWKLPKERLMDMLEQSGLGLGPK